RCGCCSSVIIWLGIKATVSCSGVPSTASCCSRRPMLAPGSTWPNRCSASSKHGRWRVSMSMTWRSSKTGSATPLTPGIAILPHLCGVASGMPVATAPMPGGIDWGVQGPLPALSFLGASGPFTSTNRQATRQDLATDPLEILERLRVQVITIKDKAYPSLLKEIYNAPSVLYVAGTLKKDEDSFALGIVGTRKVSTYGRQVTEQLARELAQGHVTVVSGLAHGIDTIAHTAALDAGGRTIAVMASGLDIIYPSENTGLARRIVESVPGALLTNFHLAL